jgi:hypothetical protein
MISPAVMARISTMMKMTRNRKNRTLAIVADPRARPVKPKRPATIENRD